MPLSKRIGLLDYPDDRKQHEFATPVVGGISIFAGMLAGWLWLGQAGRFADMVLATAGILMVLGAADDRFGLRVSVRVIVQATLVLAVIAVTGVYVHSLGTLRGHELTLGWFGIPFTVVAVIGLINAFNLMDGIDGLAGCLALLGTYSIWMLSVSRAPTVTALALPLTAALYPYLVSNLGLLGRKRKVFLGDAGSMVLGYVIAWMLIDLSQSTPRQISPGMVLWCVALPVLDTLTVMYRRLKRGVSPFTPDRTHIHHLLLDAGLGARTTLLWLVAFAYALLLLGLVVRLRAGPLANAAVFGATLVLYGSLTARLGERRRSERRHLPKHSEQATDTDG